MNVLDIEGLRVSSDAPGNPEILRGVRYSVAEGETLGVVGESGSGKSMTVLATLGLLPHGVHRTDGRILFDGADLATASHREMLRIRGSEIGLVFQDPMTALNPVMRVGAQIGEGIRRHEPRLSRRAVRSRVEQLLTEVGIAQAHDRARAYPHQFSGGMRQRVVIAMAMANRPRLLIADEPTSALDVTIQAQILSLLRSVQRETNSALIMITHDLGVVAQLCQRVVVMYAGRVVEQGSADAIFHASRHPYTAGLLASLPDLDGDPGEPLRTIGGQPPTPGSLDPGCPFRPRCFLSQGRVQCGIEPDLLEVEAGHTAACHFAAEMSDREVPAS